MKSVAVIGQGFVGGTLTTVLSERGVKVYTCDKAGHMAAGGSIPFPPLPEGRLWISSPITDVVDLVSRVEMIGNFSGIYFVCVPTPMGKFGAADTSIVESVLADIVRSVSKESVAVIRSTVPPGFTEKMNQQLGPRGLHVVFNPEFLTEANALEDMRNQKRVVLGGPRPWINAVRIFYRSAFPTVQIVKTSSTMAEMVKYFTNVQLAVRVVLSCELWQVCEALDKRGLNIDYDKIVEYAGMDPRLGGSHMNVPGNDGVPGARGHCFPKDLRALIDVAKDCGVSPTVMQAAWDKNMEVVPPEGRDWEKMIGRAVSDG